MLAGSAVSSEVPYASRRPGIGVAHGLAQRPQARQRRVGRILVQGACDYFGFVFGGCALWEACLLVHKRKAVKASFTCVGRRARTVAVRFS